MDETELPPRAPLVRYLDGTAWLRARRRDDRGAWTALVYWSARVGAEARVIEQWVTYEDIASIHGENYSHVPTLPPGRRAPDGPDGRPAVRDA
ncbi:hypothetical protein [Streptosporangium roseum]|uniref:hypothetical protein n=1 Tax=Streptosporangium roseum TaxID=2001 RepID=UPI0003120CCF|nr:hypothetical protein [Streptosporangium roseum]